MKGTINELIAINGFENIETPEFERANPRSGAVGGVGGDTVGSCSPYLREHDQAIPSLCRRC
jgi:hypothetical protein